jgi:hypothetical protein
MAMNATKIDEKLFLSDALILEDADHLQFISRKAENMIHVFPKQEIKLTDSAASITREKSHFVGFETYSVRFEELKPEVIIEEISSQKYSLQLNTDLSKLNDVFIHIDYVGDRGLAFINGELITDHFYQERKWEIGLKSFTSQLKTNKMVLIFHPMFSDYSYLKDLKSMPEFVEGKYLKVHGFEIVPEYKVAIVSNK